MKKQIYTVALIDDQPDELSMIRRYLDMLSYVRVLFIESDPLRALTLIEEQLPDILFLDIQMPGLDGLQLYRSLKIKPVLILCTGHSHYGYDASILDSAAYIPKWLPIDEFEEVMQRAVERYDHAHPGEPEESFIIVTAAQGGSARVNIPLHLIVYVAIQDKIATFHCEDYERHARISLDALAGMLPEDRFVRVHKSYIVNLAKIEAYSTSTLAFLGRNDTVPIGRAYLTEVWDRLQQPPPVGS